MALTRRKLACFSALTLASFVASQAATPARAEWHPFATSATKSKGFSNWLSDITLTGLIDGGIMANPARPTDGYNYGNFFADHANQAQLNQVVLTMQKANTGDAGEYQIGFTLQGIYGSDARYYHLVGISDQEWSSRYQLIPAQAHVDVHLPWATDGGLDMQVGILQAPMGVEVMDPTGRPFYTLAYTSEYSVPFEHVGAMFNWHVNKTVDVTFGIDTGNQVTFGTADNNSRPAGYFGINLNNLLGGKLKIVELSRVGPENNSILMGPYVANQAERFWNDINATLQVNDRLSVTAEFNFLHDQGLKTHDTVNGPFKAADAFSVVTFLSYVVSPSVTFNYRGEIYRDNNNAMVATFMGNNSYMNAISGHGASNLYPGPGGHGTTYGELTLGFNYHPDLGKGVRVFALRPEIRFDRSLNNTHPFNGGRNNGMFTFGGDAMIGF
ncbi:MAG: outer membrane beta-barrel protein [Acetobacter papayae]